MNESAAAKIFLAVFVVVAAAGVVFALNGYISPRPPVIHRPVEYAQEAKPVETTLLFTGDIMLSRNVAGRMISHNDFAYPFLNIADRVKAADIAFANLESPFSEKGPYFKEGTLVFNADPKAAEGLKFAGFDMLSTANNHALDQGNTGLGYTLKVLADAQIASVGTTTPVDSPNETHQSCRLGKVLERNGMSFGFLAYSYAGHNDGGKVPHPLVCDWQDKAQVAEDIAALKAKVDFLIVSTHMGTEYKREPEQANAELARAAVEAGADMVVGHHPHWHQTVERVPDNKLIFYSLGNFVFDQMWSQETREGMAVEVKFKGKALSDVTLLPVMIDDFCCPRWAEGGEGLNIIKKINPNAKSAAVMKDGKVADDWVAALSNRGAVPKASPLTTQ